jgi:hypothetical protein
MVEMTNNNPNCPNHILFSDEATTVASEIS